MFGSHGQPHWLDLSDYVVHFAKGDDQSGYNTLMSILYHRVVRRGPGAFGAARHIPEITESQRAVCFSEVPLGFLGRLVDRRGTRYGIAFRKRFITECGGTPLWYVEWGTPQYLAIRQMIDGASRPLDPTHPIWKLTPFIDFPSGPTAPYSYDFRWEREWRIAADVQFKQEDAVFLFIPEERHADAWGFFRDAVRENIGPGYFCPYIDPRWSFDKIDAALKSPRPEPSRW